MINIKINKKTATNKRVSDGLGGRNRDHRLHAER
jgi:hypothetical protein